MDGERSPLMFRTERLAALTLPHVCLPLGFNHESTTITYDTGSMGAQAVTFLVNKLGLTLFRPGVPFFRLSPDKDGEKAIAQNGLDINTMAEELNKAELAAVKELDRSGQRPKLTQILEHLVVAGNVLMIIEDDYIRCMGLRHWVVKRNYKGDVQTLIIREEMCADELEDNVLEAIQAVRPDIATNPDSKVCWYKCIYRRGKYYTMQQWIDDIRLPEQFDGRWPINKCPYRVATWALPDDSNYGFGVVQQYWADLEACSALNEGVTDGGVLALEMRWGVDPSGMTRAEDLNKTANGDFVNARKDDINPIFGGNPQAIAAADNVLQRIERRISAGFLMQHGITRNAERVTAEEVRMQALELETAYGGSYTAVAKDVQEPIANWTLKLSGNPLDGTGLQATVITGLDALTRNAELESLRAAFSDLQMTNQLPIPLQQRIKWNGLSGFVGAGRGVKLSSFIMTDTEYSQALQQSQAARVQEQGAVAANQAAADAAVQPQGQ
jgi:Bacteriophage head to tail connecting protein